MELNKRDEEIERIKQKAKFYFQEKLFAHVIKNPKGFLNGYFRSELKKDYYYDFEDQRFPGEHNWIKLPLVDIFNIEDYEVENYG